MPERSHYGAGTERSSLFTALILWGILSLLFFTACEKETGTVYLRVIDSIGIPSSVVVLTGDEDNADGSRGIPVDGAYYEATRWVGANIVLFDVVLDSITNWDPSMIWNQKTIYNENLDAYYGEFEKREEDSWYTLVLKYRVEEEGPKEHWVFPNVYHVVYYYYDDSDLIYSPHE